MRVYEKLNDLNERGIYTRGAKLGEDASEDASEGSEIYRGLKIVRRAAVAFSFIVQVHPFSCGVLAVFADSVEEGRILALAEIASSASTDAIGATTDDEQMSTSYAFGSGLEEMTFRRACREGVQGFTSVYGALVEDSVRNIPLTTVVALGAATQHEIVYFQ